MISDKSFVKSKPANWHPTKLSVTKVDFRKKIIKSTQVDFQILGVKKVNMRRSFCRKTSHEHVTRLHWGTLALR